MAGETQQGRFGALFKAHRRRLGKTLREFCREHGLDHGNMSKMERGLLKPPTGKRLEEYLAYLGIEQASDEWYELHDLASVCRGMIPERIMREEELVRMLPVVFRSVGRGAPTEEDIRALVELMKDHVHGSSEDRVSR